MRLNREGGLFELAKMMVSILHKDLERKVETLKHMKSEVSAVEDPKQNLNFQHVNKAYRISPHEVL